MYDDTKALAALLDIAMFAHANGEEFESPITEDWLCKINSVLVAMNVCGAPVAAEDILTITVDDRQETVELSICASIGDILPEYVVLPRSVLDSEQPAVAARLHQLTGNVRRLRDTMEAAEKTYHKANEAWALAVRELAEFNKNVTHRVVSE